MEFTPLIPQRFPTRTLVLTRAELSEVLCCSGHGIGEEMDLDAAEWFTWMM